VPSYLDHGGDTHAMFTHFDDDDTGHLSEEVRPILSDEWSPGYPRLLGLTHMHHVMHTPRNFSRFWGFPMARWLNRRSALALVTKCVQSHTTYILTCAFDCRRIPAMVVSLRLCKCV
jgi:hypothetical protein